MIFQSTSSWNPKAVLQADDVILHQSRKGDFLEWLLCQDAGAALRKIEIGIRYSDYLDFLSVCIEDRLTVEENLKAIIRYHIIVYRNSKKLKNQKLF